MVDSISMGPTRREQCLSVTVVSPLTPTTNNHICHLQTLFLIVNAKLIQHGLYPRAALPTQRALSTISIALRSVMYARFTSRENTCSRS